MLPYVFQSVKCLKHDEDFNKLQQEQSAVQPVAVRYTVSPKICIGTSHLSYVAHQCWSITIIQIYSYK